MARSLFNQFVVVGFQPQQLETIRQGKIVCHVPFGQKTLWCLYPRHLHYVTGLTQKCMPNMLLDYW